MGGFSLAAPWLLVAAVALPALYFLLRMLPPAAQRTRLPSFRLLGPADIPPPPSARPPWWLLLLRIGMIALFIAGLAGPRWQAVPDAPPPARLTIVIDNGWTAASSWERMVAAAAKRIDALVYAGTQFRIVPTIAGNPEQTYVDANTARAQLAALAPQPWAADRAALAGKLSSPGAALWIADGLEDGGAPALRRALKGAEILSFPPSDPAFRIAGRTGDGWSAQLVSADPANATRLQLIDARGNRLHREPLDFDNGVATPRVTLSATDRSSVSRLSAGRGTLAATYLVDADENRPRVVIIEGESDAPPLESGGFYVRRALEPHADIQLASLDTAANDPATLFIAVDVAANDVQAAPLLHRVDKGAVVILFAGPRIAANDSAFSPLPLRTGARALGGVLSWQEPQTLGGFSGDGPLAGLPINSEVRVSRQLLAASDNGVERWAWLADDTPVVSAARHGAGLLILVHTAADPSWSSFPLTGFFESLLTRLLPLANNPRATDISGGKPWILERMLGARGEWLDPPRRIEIAPGTWDTARASKATPAGIYQSGDARRPLNFTSALGPRFSFEALSTDGLIPAATAKPPFDIGRWLILAAALLAAFDILVALRMRGALAPLAITMILVTLAPDPAHAADDLQLAYIRSGNAALDAMSARGLDVLGRTLKARTSVAPAEPVAVDPASDNLGRYPVLYWPANAVRHMSPATASRIRDYLARGGLILFDFGKPLGADSGARALLEPLGLPPLAEVGPDHVLSKSFYFLDSFAGGALWAESGTEGSAGHVSGVIIGGGGWAGLWSGDIVTAPSRRERALRFGVNLVMYALTGTYKADQVHTGTLLERLGKPK